MFDYIQGDLVQKTPTQAVIATAGVGYRFTIPVSTFDVLPDSGQAKLFTHLHVREDVLRLYGFATDGERRLFTRLIAVQGIGPGIAIAVLNGLAVDDFRRAVADEEVAAICRIKGIGRKIAQRIVLELQHEMERDLLERPAGRARVPAPTSDAVAAMMALGYRRSASEKAVAEALAKLGRKASLEQVVREALQQV